MAGCLLTGCKRAQIVSPLIRKGQAPPGGTLACPWLSSAWCRAPTAPRYRGHPEITPRRRRNAPHGLAPSAAPIDLRTNELQKRLRRVAVPAKHATYRDPHQHLRHTQRHDLGLAEPAAGPF